MVSDVETILNQIRERVLAEEQTAAPAEIRTAPPASDANGSGEPVMAIDNESLARISAHLSVTARAWDRLPPVVSNRTGTLARLELWIKTRCRSLTRWFTWEQVNFNAAVHHALIDALAALNSQERELASLRSLIANESTDRTEKIEGIDRELLAARARLEIQAAELLQLKIREAELEKELAARFEVSNATLELFSSMLTELAEEIRASRSQVHDEIKTRLEQSVSQIATVAADLREQQRVCFKQLSLETSEAAILEDRGRRALEARLAKLEKASGDSA